VDWVVPVEAEWTTESGVVVKAQGETEQVNAHGALLRLRGDHPIARELMIRNLEIGRTTDASAVWKASEGDGTMTLAVSLSTPSEEFWGVSLPPVGT
jgi:hypothetical protein